MGDRAVVAPLGAAKATPAPRPAVAPGADWPSRLLLAAVLAYVGFLLVAPLVALVAQVAAAPAAAWTAVRAPDTVSALLLSLVLAGLALAINGVAGVAGAVVLVRHRFWGRAVADALVDLPLAVSPVMTGLAFFVLFGRQGVLGPALDAAGLKVVFAFPGLLLATLFVTLPFTLREVAFVLDEIGSSEEEAAATLGATPWRTFWHVTLPNVRHGLATGATLTVARALGEFGAVLVLGGAISGRTQTATTYVHAALEERNEPGAFGVALLLAAVGAALLVLLHRPTSTRRS